MSRTSATIARAIAVTILSVFSAASVRAQSSAALTQRAEQATEQLLQLAARVRAGDATAKAQLLTVAAERRAAMLPLVESDVRSVLRLALPPPTRASLPPDVQALVEEHTTLQGPIDVFSADYADSSRVFHFMQVQQRRLALRFASEPAALLSGAVIRATGVVIGDVFAAEGGASIQQVSTAAPYSFGEQRVLMILVTFRDKTAAPYTSAFAHDVLFGAGSVDEFDRENSQQQTWLTGDVAGWFAIPVDSTTCNESSIRTYAQQAATAAGYNLSHYNRFVYGFPTNACSWSGYGQIGGLPTHAWINGNLRMKVVAHELGHNHGLYHARALDCHPYTIGANCGYVEYGDAADTMGMASAAGHFNAFQKERLGWLNYGASPPLLTVTGSGTFAIEPFAGPGSGPKALKILKSTDPSTGKRTWYYVEYRALVGFDSTLTNGNVSKGLIVHTGSESAGNSSYMLDMTPETTYFTDPALVPGRAFTDAAAGVTITPVSIDASGAAVSVQFGSAPTCTAAAPTLAVSPTTTQWASAGATMRWTLVLRNNDSSACTASSFDIGAGVPTGWSAGVSSPIVSPLPGQSVTVTVDVTSASAAADRIYDLVFSAARGTTITVSGTYGVQTVQTQPPTVAVTTDAASYVRNQTVRIRGTVTAAGNPVAGAMVTFLVQSPDGGSQTISGQTDATGAAAASYKITRKASPGTWTVRASVTVGGSAVSVSTAFSVR